MKKDELDAEIIKSARELLDLELSNCNEYVIPYNQEPQVIELSKKWFAFNLTVSGAVDKRKIYEIIKEHKFNCNLEDFTDNKYISVFINKKAPVQDYIKPPGKVFVIKQKDFQTHIIL